MKLGSTYNLDSFEGPLDFLLHLIQRREVDVVQIPIHHLVAQFQQKWPELNLDQGAEFLGQASLLLWLKSKTLLPQEEQAAQNEELELDPQFEIIHQLLEYCRFKNAAKELSLREQQQSGFYLRGGDYAETKKPLGIEHLTLDDLAGLFQQVVAKSNPQGRLQAEEWKVGDKIIWLKRLAQERDTIPFFSLFSPQLSKGELIVIFLAILELMKMGLLSVVRNPDEVVYVKFIR